MKEYDIVIVGGGPAGLAAAVAAKKEGIQSVLVIERDRVLGGILNQCIHNGFGLHTFDEELTGPEYAGRYIAEAEKEKIECKLNSMVMSISDHKVTYMNSSEGIVQIGAEAVILAMGCRERPRGALNIPGFRPAGIYSAGTAQRLVNIEGFMPGRKVVILGSGDIGLIMARRMTLEGAKVYAVAELMPYSGGLKRNIVQCLDDFGIPLKLSHTVVDIEGKKRVSAVVLAQVDENLRPVKGTEERIECDTLLLSCGLIPENELSLDAGIKINNITKGAFVDEMMQTQSEGIFACGNVLHVHDLVDFVSEEAEHAGRCAAAYVKTVRANDKKIFEEMRYDVNKMIEINPEGGVRYTVPSYIHERSGDEKITVRFRVGAVYKNIYISVYAKDERIRHSKKMIVTPGEMESVELKHSELAKLRAGDSVTIKLEDQ